MRQPKISEIASGKYNNNTFLQASEATDAEAAEPISSYLREIMRTRLMALSLEIRALTKILDQQEITITRYDLERITMRHSALMDAALNIK